MANKTRKKTIPVGFAERQKVTDERDMVQGELVGVRITWRRLGHLCSHLTFTVAENERPDLVALWPDGPLKSLVCTGVRTSVCENADPGMFFVSRIHTADIWHPTRWLDVHDRRVHASLTGQSEGWVTRQRRRDLVFRTERIITLRNQRRV